MMVMVRVVCWSSVFGNRRRNFNIFKIPELKPTQNSVEEDSRFLILGGFKSTGQQKVPKSEIEKNFDTTDLSKIYFRQGEGGERYIDVINALLDLWEDKPLNLLLRLHIAFPQPAEQLAFFEISERTIDFSKEYYKGTNNMEISFTEITINVDVSTLRKRRLPQQKPNRQ